MARKTRPSPHAATSRGLLVLLGASVFALFALVWVHGNLPTASAHLAPAAANLTLPPSTFAISDAESHDAVRLQAALDRMGFDLEAVAHGYMSVPSMQVATLPPDLDHLDAIDDRKSLFLRLLLPVVLQVNERIGADRSHLLALRTKMNAGVTLEADEVQWIMTQADAYDQPDADVEALLRKIDVIPPSLALAQAIEESGWGTSRIARQGNALFGQFGQDEDGDWNYRNFATLTDAVAAYVHNLNTHRAYREFRLSRAHMRSHGGDIDAWNLATTLHRYSERGDEYVQSLRVIMQNNGLEAFDSARLNVRRVAMIVARAD